MNGRSSVRLMDVSPQRDTLEALLRHAAYERLQALGGSEPSAKDVPRRAGTSPRKRRVA
jgi:hypothetical protein